MERLIQNYHFDEDQKLLQEMKETIYSNPAAMKYLRQNKISDEVIENEIVKIYDFVSDLNFCKKCPGLSACNKQTPRLCTRITYQNGVISRELVPCKKYLEFIKFQSQFKVRDFPDEWLNTEIKKMDKTAERKEAIEKYTKYFKGENSEWLYLMGEEGTGRSFLAANIAIDIAKKDLGPVSFIDVSSRFKELASTKDNDKFNALLESYASVPVLVLDDLGNEYKSDFVRENILFAILNKRAKKHLYTIITSDFNINDIAYMYQTNQASKPKAEQIKRLLKRMCGQEINQGNISVY